MIALAPEVDVQFAKPAAPTGWLEVPGLLVAVRTRLDGGTFDVRYPRFVFDNDTYLPAGDTRRITGWSIRSCLTRRILARPIRGMREIGQTVSLGPRDIPKQLTILGSTADEGAMNTEGLGFMVVPRSDAGVLFYVDQDDVSIWLEKQFDADFSERRR